MASSALTPPAVQAIFQGLVLQILGITVDPKNPGAAAKQVRVAWNPQRGKPGWEPNEDITVIKATVFKHPYNRVRDNVYDTDSETLVMGYTQVWNVAFICYGPTSYQRATLIRSAMSLEWVRFYLQQIPQYVSQLFMVGSFKEPTYIPEDFQGQWWYRTDLELQFNEQVNETITTPSVASLDVEVITDTNVTETVHIAAE